MVSKNKVICVNKNAEELWSNHIKGNVKSFAPIGEEHFALSYTSNQGQKISSKVNIFDLEGNKLGNLILVT